MKVFLNVGGGSKTTSIPNHYLGWRHDLLDIDPQVKPDILCDGREINKLRSESYNSVYCSHNLEHYYDHDTYKVVKGFLHVLKKDGFINIIVPNIFQAVNYAISNNLDIDDSLGNISFKDVIYGYGKQIETSNNDFYAHKTGFTAKSLKKLVLECGFMYPVTSYGLLEIKIYAFKQKPSEELKIMLNLKDDDF
ncbi:MAG: class I SAM-dependent methyltransferase [Candidatus Sericytochromatia bacterium]|nr:class I SAM-dependent methyltransferase [Candidatus Sericytochromatia bacterium]